MYGSKISGYKKLATKPLERTGLPQDNVAIIALP
jgi:hypothetical protein